MASVNVMARCVTCMAVVCLPVEEFLAAIDSAVELARVTGNGIVIECDDCTAQRQQSKPP
jgi:hypothetical protein